MNWNLFKGYFLVIFSGLVILAAVILVVLEWDREAKFSIYGSDPVDVNTALLMLASGAGGIVLLYLVKLMFRGIRSLRKGRKQQAVQQVLAQPKARSQPPASGTS